MLNFLLWMNDIRLFWVVEVSALNFGTALLENSLSVCRKGLLAMRSNVVKLTADPNAIDANRAAEFARELSALGRKYGLGIAGDAKLFVLESEDRSYDYGVGRNSELVFGG
jgi:hypothetical protein